MPIRSGVRQAVVAEAAGAEVALQLSVVATICFTVSESFLYFVWRDAVTRVELKMRNYGGEPKAHDFGRRTSTSQMMSLPRTLTRSVETSVRRCSGGESRPLGCAESM